MYKTATSVTSELDVEMHYAVAENLQESNACSRGVTPSKLPAVETSLHKVGAYDLFIRGTWCDAPFSKRATTVDFCVLTFWRSG